MVGVASITSQNSQLACDVKANLQAKFGHGWLGTAEGSVSHNSDTSMVYSTSLWWTYDLQQFPVGLRAQTLVASHMHCFLTHTFAAGWL